MSYWILLSSKLCNGFFYRNRLTAFWILGVLWVSRGIIDQTCNDMTELNSIDLPLHAQTLFYWCSETSQNTDDKVIFKVNSDRKGSAMAIDSLDISEDEKRENHDVERLKDEVKSPKVDFVYVNDTLPIDFIVDENTLAKQSVDKLAAVKLKIRYGSDRSPSIRL